MSKLIVLALLPFFLIAVQGCGASLNGSTPPNEPPQGMISAASTQKWVTQFGTGTVVQPAPNTSQYPGDLMSAIAATPDGGVYAAGYTLGSFPGFPTNPNHVAEPYLARFNSTGQQIWIQQFSTGSGDFIDEAVVDPSGNVFLSGSTLGAFPGFSNASGMAQALIVKLDPNGNRLWLKQFTVEGNITEITTAALGPSGQLFVAGVLVPNSSTHYQNLFLAAVDGSTGAVLWQKTFGASASNTVNSVAVDTNGAVYFTGITSGPFPGSASQDFQPFVAKLATNDGHQLWVQPLSSLQSSAKLLLSSIAISPDGNVIVGGAESSDYLLVGQYAATNAKALVLKLAATSGDVIWQQTYKSGEGDQISSLRVLSNSTIYAAGSTNGVFSTQFSQPSQNLFLLKLNSLGEAQWVQQFGTGPILNVSTIQFGVHITVNSTNDVFVGGATQGTYSGATNPFTAVEGFVSKFGP